jgi:5'-nucleotidase/UDP-sugar diphosphatase
MPSPRSATASSRHWCSRVGGQKIGIIGAVTTDTPEIASPGPNIAMEDDIKTITAEVEKLKAEGVNKIIALTHVGYPRDKELIAKIPGVDVVVGGHSHSLLSNTDAKAEGPYPTMIDNPEGYKVPVTQAASYSKYLGEFTVTFDDNGVVKGAKGDPIYLDNSVKPDEAVLARIKELGAPIEELKNKEVAEDTDLIDGSRDNCRARECAMGNLISDAILDRVKDQGVTIVFQNGGGIRASIDKGVVTMGEVLTVLPFQNTLATFQLSGKDIVASLEAGVSEIEEGKGKFPQVAGLKYSFDKSVAANAGRIKSVEVMDGGAWKPIDEAKVYTVATNNYVRQGGDGYKLFASNATNAYDYGPSLEQVVADYLGKNRPFTPSSTAASPRSPRPLPQRLLPSRPSRLKPTPRQRPKPHRQRLRCRAPRARSPARRRQSSQPSLPRQLHPLRRHRLPPASRTPLPAATPSGIWPKPISVTRPSGRRLPRPTRTPRPRTCISAERFRSRRQLNRANCLSKPARHAGRVIRFRAGESGNRAVSNKVLGRQNPYSQLPCCPIPLQGAARRDIECPPHSIRYPRNGDTE